MPISLLALAILVAAFVVAEILWHSRQLSLWTASAYFSIMGLGTSMGAFALVNLALARSAASSDARSGFRFFAATAGSGALLASLVIAILTLSLRKRLSSGDVLTGLVVLFSLACGLLSYFSTNPGFNWW